MGRSAYRIIVLNCILHALLFGQEAGLDPSRDIGQYSHRAWTKREGLPQNSVTSIAQTMDGYLWFGTMEGLARFDGTAFSTLNTRNTPVLGINYILALLADHDSTLWIGTNGGGLLRIRNREIRRFDLAVKQEHIVVRQLMEDREGNVWAATSIGLAQCRHDSLVHLYTIADGLPANFVIASIEDQAGRILALTPKGIWMRQRGCFEPYVARKISESSKGSPPAPCPAGAIELKAAPTAFLSDHLGRLWIGTAENGIFVLTGDSLRNITEKQGLSPGVVSAIVEDQRGTIWIGTLKGGISRFADNRVTKFTSADGLSGDDVLSICEDREGVLWVGVSTGGVNRFINSKFATFRTGSNAVDNMVWGVFVDPPGRLLAATAGGTIVEYHNGVFVPSAIMPGKLFSAPAGEPQRPGGLTFAFVHDRAGVRWIGGGDGVTRYAEGKARLYRVGSTMSICEDRYGRIWAASAEGLWCFVGIEPQLVLTSQGVRPVRLRDVSIDSGGNLWMATRDDGVIKYRLPLPSEKPPVLDEESAVRFTRQEGLSTDWVTTMVVDSEGTAWVATYGGGLNVIRGTQVQVLTSAQGLPEEGLMGIALDGLGSLWLTSNNGVHRIGLSQLREYLEGRRSALSVESFGTSDGMYSDEFNGGFRACVARTPDGKLWFPSTFGVVMVDPARLPINAVPPAVVLERVRIDNIEGLPQPGSEYPPGNGELEFHFAGLSSNAPERIQYHYMLEGFNRDWIDAGTRREAFYTNIPPGTYRFRVMARNADGAWNESGISFPFVLRPHFSQTAWFGLLIGLLVVSAVVGVWYLYKRDRDRELQASQLESKLSQAQLQILEMQLQPHFLFNTLNGIMVLIKHEPDMASRMIARLSEFLRLTLESAGEQEVTLRRELEYLNRYVQIEQLRFGDRLTVEQQVSPDVLEALVPNLILQPLVENAIKHGVSKRRGPAVIRVQVERDNGSLTIHVRDNGGGLPVKSGEGIKEGIGIRNTRSRLQYLYGTAQGFDLTSPAEGGVDVRLTIPYHKVKVV